jgi:hypothetical protein
VGGYCASGGKYWDGAWKMGTEDESILSFGTQPVLIGMCAQDGSILSFGTQPVLMTNWHGA